MEIYKIRYSKLTKFQSQYFKIITYPKSYHMEADTTLHNQKKEAEQKEVVSSDEGQQLISESSGEQDRQGPQNVNTHFNQVKEPHGHETQTSKNLHKATQSKDQTLILEVVAKNKRQRQNEILPSKFSTKQIGKKIFFEDEYQWKAEAESDNEGQDNKYFMQFDSDAQNQITAVYDDAQVDDLINPHEQAMNNAFLDKEISITYDHMVQNKHLLVLYLLYKKQINLLFPKQKYNRIDVHPSNKNKIRIFASNHEQIKQVSLKMSEMINSISIVKLNIKNEEAYKIKSSKILSKKLLKDKMIIFKYGNMNEKSFYLGGKGSQPYLSSVFKQIRNLRFRYFRMFDYCNTRSYKIILNHFVQQKQLLKSLYKWNIKSLQLVNFIPNFGGNNHNQQQKQKSLCFLMTTHGTVDNLSPKQLENNLSSFIRNAFYSIILIFKQGEQYLPKLNVQNVTFKFVSQKKFNRSYVYVLCQKKNFFQRRDQIIKQLQKFEAKNQIYGVRYFRNLAPQLNEYIKPEKYKILSFPQYKPYSFSVVPKRQVEEKEAELQQNKQLEVRVKEQTKEKVAYNYFNFDWKEHLSSLQSTQISFIQEKN